MLQQTDPRIADLIVDVGGKLFHRDDAGVSPFESAVQGGDAAWEGLRLFKGWIFNLIEFLNKNSRKYNGSWIHGEQFADLTESTRFRPA